MLFGKTGFKISGAVGIIILLLGITVLFGMYQMAKVSNEIVNISEAYEPLQNILGEIRYYQAMQIDSFERSMLNPTGPELEKAKEVFWSSNVLIKSNIQQGKNLAETAYNVATTDEIGNNFKTVHRNFEELEKAHLELELITKDAINSGKSDEFVLGQVAAKKIHLQSKIDVTADQIAKFNDQSINAIEEYERGWLYVQIGIIVAVGIIALFMRQFIGQINGELKKEIESKTEELRTANKKLQELDKLKNEFISIASHELKSPIQPIFGFAELAQSGDIDQKEAWDGVTTLAKKLQELANDVLDVTRIESNRLTLYQERLPINGIIRDTANMMRASLQKDLRIEEELDDDVELEVDRVRIEQVLRNLISNAIKFTDRGTIKIKTRVDAKTSSLIITVSDTGLGIPKDILPNIFGKFVTKGHERENQSGNGLGLFLCKGIVEAHGGRISAKNNTDCGATFEVSLPLAEKTVQTLTN